jgi:hypothetical protein
MRVYIAGKMRGIYNFNKDAFYKAEELLVAEGYSVFNPITCDLDNGIPLDSPTGSTDDIPMFGNAMRKEIIKRDVENLLDCDAIYLLRSWKDSKGARAEKALAEWDEMPVIFEEKPTTQPRNGMGGRE